MPTTHQFFVSNLLQWHQTVERNMPWKGEKNAYLIWLSEIILQQTRVEQGLPYFLKFKEKYPTVIHLANAPEDEVMKLWQGLGYYSRARNLHATAKIICDNYNGIFPEQYEQILALKGIGTYTAAAIASFAFEQVHAVVDGNVYRVLSRFFGVDIPIDSPKAKKQFTDLAYELIKYSASPSAYNQAIMDFGALQCKPVSPACKQCLLQKKCWAFQNNEVNNLPVKEKKIKVKERFFQYLIIKDNKHIYLQKRMEQDIWKDLYEFPLIEGHSFLSEKKLRLHTTWQQLFKKIKIKIADSSKNTTQKLTHQVIHAQFIEVWLPKNFSVSKEGLQKVALNEIHKFAFPKIIDWYFQNKQLNLNFNHK